jgi:hypothetical protein
MTYTIKFTCEPQAVHNYGADLMGYCFHFTIIDSAFSETPEESSHMQDRTLCVTAIPEKKPWKRSDLSEQDLMKVLFHYCMEEIKELISKGKLPIENPIQKRIDTSSTPVCPVTDLHLIPDSISGHTFQVTQPRIIEGFH